MRTALAAMAVLLCACTAVAQNPTDSTPDGAIIIDLILPTRPVPCSIQPLGSSDPNAVEGLPGPFAGKVLLKKPIACVEQIKEGPVWEFGNEFRKEASRMRGHLKPNSGLWIFTIHDLTADDPTRVAVSLYREVEESSYQQRFWFQIFTVTNGEYGEAAGNAFLLFVVEAQLFKTKTRKFNF